MTAVKGNDMRWNSKKKAMNKKKAKVTPETKKRPGLSPKTKAAIKKKQKQAKNGKASNTASRQNIAKTMGRRA